MPKITLAKEIAILSEVSKKAETKFHGAMQAQDEAKAEATLEQDLMSLENHE